MTTHTPSEAQSSMAVSQLTDRRQVGALFKRLDQLVENGAAEQEKAKLVGDICLSLAVQVESELFPRYGRAPYVPDQQPGARTSVRKEAQRSAAVGSPRNAWVRLHVLSSVIAQSPR